MNNETNESQRRYKGETVNVQRVDGTLKIAPESGTMIRKYLPIVFVLESILFVVIFGGFLFLDNGSGIFGEGKFVYLVLLLFLSSNIIPIAFFFIYTKEKAWIKSNTWYNLSPERTITVRDREGNEVEIVDHSSLSFEMDPFFDENGLENYDVSLRDRNQSYYLVSVREKSEAEKLVRSLQQDLE